MNQNFVTEPEGSSFVSASPPAKTEKGDLSLEALETAAVSAELAQERARARRENIGSVLLTGMMIVLFSSFVSRKAELFASAAGFFWLAFLMLLTYSVPIALSVRQTRKRRALVQRLTRKPELPSISALFAALSSEDKTAKRPAMIALTSRLPHLTEAEALALTPSQKGKLGQVFLFDLENPLRKDVTALLRPADLAEVQFRAAVLQAFAQIGDSKCLPMVEKIAGSEAKTEGEKLLKETARQVLPALNERIFQQRSSQTLLRPSEADTGNALLRPATETDEADASQLLRSSE